MIENMVVKRNDTDLGFVEMEVLKGKNKGEKFLAPPIDYSTDEKWDVLVKWFGKDTIAGFMQAQAKLACRAIYRDCIDATTGKLNEPKFLELASDPFAAAMTLAEIGAKLEEAQAALGVLVDQIPDEGEPSTDLRHAIKEARSYIVGLKEMFAKRKRNKPEEPEETDQTEPAAAVR